MHDCWKDKLPVDDVIDIIPITGGDVNDAYKVQTQEGMYFMLVQPYKSRDFYAAEISGLEDFKKAGITAPEVISSGEIDGNAYLLLSYMDEGRSGSQSELGEMIAKLHKYHQPNGKFGYHLPFDFGDVEFNNDWTDSWERLFVGRRMDVLRDIIAGNGMWNEDDLKKYEDVRGVIIDTLESHESVPSLLHGDLWGGNYMFLTDGTPALFDPAPLYGDREFDLGATTVFGGFTEEFYKAYDASYPLSEGAKERIQFYKLYLLLLHLAKFGSLYYGSVDRVMEDIINSADRQSETDDKKP